MTKPHDPGLVNWKGRTGRLSLGLAALTFALFLASNWDGAFVFDDRPNLTENPAVTFFEPASLESWWKAAFESPARLRPLPYLTFAWQWRLFGENPAAFHVFNDFLHALSAVALFWLLLELFTAHKSLPLFKNLSNREREFLAAACALLWAVHPVQTQAVTYLVQRMTVMSGFFSFLAFGFYLKGKRTEKRQDYIIAGISFALALLSKESAAVLPVVGLLYEWLMPADKEEHAGQRTRVLGLLLACIPPLLMALTYAWLSPLHFGVGTMPGRDYTLFERMISAPRAYVRYLALLVFPHPLALDYGLSPSKGFLSPWTTLPALALIASGVAALLASQRKQPLLAFAGVGFFLSLAPESTFLNVEFFYEHRLYLASAFALPLFPVGLAWLTERREGLKKPLLAIFALVVIVLGASTAVRNRIWSSSIRLLETNARARPQNGRVEYNLGQEFLRKNGLQDAVRHYERAEALGYREAPFALGTALQRMGDTSGALAAYERALKAHPRPSEVWANLGVLAKSQGRFEEAEKDYHQALDLDPRNTAAYVSLANLYLAQRKDKEALQALDKALEIDPDRADAHFNRMIVHIRAGKLLQAYADWKTARDLGFEKANEYEALFASYEQNEKERQQGR